MYSNSRVIQFIKQGDSRIEGYNSSLYKFQGYCVIRGFISHNETELIRRFWHRHPLAHGKKGYWQGRKDFAMHENTINQKPTLLESVMRSWGNKFTSSRKISAPPQKNTDQRYECFFWNRPLDVLTYEIAWSIQIVRNIVSGHPLYKNFQPLDGYASSYRITRTVEGGGIPLHSDARTADESDLIQASLSLSRYNGDFKGGEFFLRLLNGEDKNIYLEDNIQPGDLILFNQVLPHWVNPVISCRSDDPLSGSWRVLMPDHPVVDRPHDWQKGMVTATVRVAN